MREPIVLDRRYRLIGVLHRPDRSELCPAILICHGYAGTKIGSRRLYVELAERLESCGIATLRLDFSGCGDSEGHFSNVALTDLVLDARRGLDCLRDRCDPDRLGLLGVSLGGAIATLAAKDDGNVQSLALWAAVACGKLWSEDWAHHFPDQVVDGMLACGGVISSSLFCEQFLAMRADQVLQELDHLPLYHVQAGTDRNVRAGHADRFRSARKGSAATSRFTLLPESGHGFAHVDERQQLLDETVDWFQTTLGAR